MFGDIIMFEKTISVMDYKGRITLPSFTGAEIGDVVALEIVKMASQEANKEQELSLRIHDYRKLCDFINLKLESADSLEGYNKLVEELANISKTFVGICDVKAQGRVQIPSSVRDEIGFTPGTYDFEGEGITARIRKRK